MRVDRSADDGASEEADNPGAASPDATGVSIRKNTTGFSSWGGVARSERYILLSDPSGLISSNAALKGDAYEGAVGIAPSEIAPTP